ncbi:Zinc finger CCCH domain-containing protein 66 [Linum grandiflorum]
MCNGSKSKSTTPMAAESTDDGSGGGGGGSLCRDFSPLLEFSASDDLPSFKTFVEEKGLTDVNQPGLWYGRRIGSNKMGLEVRTPLIIAAMYGSKAVLSYILQKTLPSADVIINQPCGSDGATALHCAAAPGNSDVVKLLLRASADPNSLEGEEIGSLLPDEIEIDASMTMTATAAAKKEYPIDVTLPDIKNGIYGTDEFRMFSFKVKPCSRAYSHDWTECPFVHPGENARRRDPRKYLYTCVPCPEFRKGSSCRQGDACEYAHGIFECWLHPAQYRTRLCKDETNCTRRVCFFAHKTEELRPLYPSTGSAVPTPTTTSYSGFDIGSLTLSTPPLTSPGGGGSPWSTASVIPAPPPALQLPGSRLKSSLSARDIDVDVELLGMEAHRRRRQLMDEFEFSSGMSSPSGEFSKIGGLNFNPTSVEDYPLLLSRLQDMNLKLRSTYPAARMEQTGFNINSGRAAAFAKRSQSFVGRSSVNHQHPMGFPSSPGKISDWGSPDGKLDWKIQGEELSKFRKSASFGYRSSNGNVADPGMGSGLGGPNQQQELVPAWMEQFYGETEQMVAS